MADPLSVAASIAGLLAIAGKITTTVVDLTSKSKAAPKDIQYVKTSVETIRAVLLQLQLLLLGRTKIDRRRTSLILVEQVVITLSACVSTFSELDVFVDTLNTDNDMGLLDRIRWATKSSTIKELLDRLEAHKASLTLMTTILTCDSTYKAEDAVDALADMVQQVLTGHQILAQRLLSIELGMDVGLPLTKNQNVGDDSTSQEVPPQPKQPQRHENGFAFEEVLETSWVYKRAARHGDDQEFSVISAAGRTASWSMLSGLSLSDISFIAVLALPVYEHDISNSEYYKFGEYMDDEVHATMPLMPYEDKSEKVATRSRFGARLSRIAAGINFRTRPEEPGMDNARYPEHRIFGVPLRLSITYANVAISLLDEEGNSYVYGYIPIVVAKTGVFLKEKGESVENIFHTSGSAFRVQQLQSVFDSPDRYGKGFDWEGYTVHDAASVLLRYLKSLPEPVLTFDLYDSFIKAAGWAIKHWKDNRGEQVEAEATIDTIEALQKLVMSLPRLNRQLLIYMLDIFAVFADKFYKNLMTASRLVAVVQPALLSKPTASMTATDYEEAATVLVFMIEQQDHFYIGI